MYLTHYGLTKKPFNISPDPDFLWLGEKHAEALSGLEYGILENKGFLLLTGEAGTGKTVLIRGLIKLMDQEVIVANIQDPRLELLDFYNMLAYKLKMNRRFEKKGDFLIYFEEFLIKTYRHNKKLLLIIDEAQRLNSELLDEIRVLSNIELDNRKLINIFFVGQSELKKILLEERNRPLEQRITYNYHLGPLIEQETASFIEHRLKVAGASRKFFTEKAIREIHNFSQGIPRLINIICDHCLITGYSAGLTTIDASVTKECAKELQISLDRPSPPSKQTKVIEYQSPSRQQQAIKLIRKPEPSNKAANLKIAGIGIIIVLIFGIGASFFYMSRIEQSPNLLIKDIDILMSEDSKENSKKQPLEIADSHGTTEDTSTGKLTAEKIQSDEKIAEINAPEEQPDNEIKVHDADTVSKGEVKNLTIEDTQNQPLEIADSHGTTEDTSTGKLTAEKIQSDEKIAEINAPEEQPDNEIEESKTDAVSKSEVAEVYVPRKEFSNRRNLIINDEKNLILKVNQSNMPPNNRQSLMFSEHKFIIHFEHNSVNLDNQAFAKLKEIAEILSQNSKSEIAIEGYADSNGNFNYNKTLSQFRSNIVESYLISQGVAKSSIKAIGLGSQNPIGNNRTRKGRSKNRRVEIKIKTGGNGNSMD